MADTTDESRQQIATLRAQGLNPKAIAKKLALRPAQVSEIIRQQAEARAVDQPESQRPLARCLVSPAWASGLILDSQAKEWPGAPVSPAQENGLAIVLVAREYRYDKVLASSFMLDLFCLGAKSVIPPKILTRTELDAFTWKVFSQIGDPLIAPLELAQNLVFGSIDYARNLGFEPDPDFEKARSLLGEWAGPGHIQFGRNGKPFFVNGPHDDVDRTLATLRRTVGEGNYDFVLGGPA